MTAVNYQGGLRKMQVSLNNETTKASYQLTVGDNIVDIESFIGQKIAMTFEGDIHCIHCNRKTKKSFNQGYCYPCLKKLAQCDSCIVKPEQCHYFEGTCREPEWGEQHCLQPHYVYLANSSGAKVGITRGTQIPTRWIDQGAVQALPIAKVSNRLQSGLVEVALKDYIADKTNWRKMLKNDVEVIDLKALQHELHLKSESVIHDLQAEHGEDAIEWLTDAESVDIDFPVLEYPTKVTSFNFDKQPVVEGVLKGIKGQYLIMDTGVINIRKFAGYTITFTA